MPDLKELQQRVCEAKGKIARACFTIPIITAAVALIYRTLIPGDWRFQVGTIAGAAVACFLIRLELSALIAKESEHA